MRNLILLLVLFGLNSCTGFGFSKNSIDPKKDSVFVNKQYKSEVNIKDFTSTGKTYYFIKLWGFLKYNADFDNVDIDWDDYFITNISKVNLMNEQQYRAFISNTLLRFPKPVNKEIKNNIKDYSLIDNDWFNTTYFDDKTSKELFYMFENREIKNSKFISNHRIGNLIFNNEKKYDENDYPAENLRILSLARYWNIINYFFVYKNDINENWDKVLLDFIPKFINSKNTSEYHLAVQELSSKLYDCHSMVRSEHLDNKVFGRYTPNFRISYIDTIFVISKIRTEKYNNRQLNVGDIILKINDTPIKERYDQLNKIFKGANPPSERRIICPYLCSSTKDKMELTILRNGEQKQIVIELRDYWDYQEEENRIASIFEKELLAKEISSGVYYLSLDNLSKSNLQMNLDKVKDATNLILDLRSGINDPVIKDMANFILPKESDFFMNTYSDVNHPGLLRIGSSYKLGKDDGNYFKGNVYVLVNENTQSSAEFSTMAFQMNPKTTVVGSQTAGSDGNIAMFHFPGNIQTVFTGIGIYYPDMSPTQRIGVKIDHNVKPTIKGISNGKDEILEKCISLIIE